MKSEEDDLLKRLRDLTAEVKRMIERTRKQVAEIERILKSSAEAEEKNKPDKPST